MRRGTHGGLRFIKIAPIPALALLVAACSSAGTGANDSSSSFSSLFRASSPDHAAAVAASAPGAAAAPAAPGGVKALEVCPNVELRQGAATLTVNNNAKDPSAMQLRYQVSVTQMARECSLAGGTLTIRVGIQGRIVLGPAGTHGALEIPIRYALVDEGPEPKMIYTKLYKFPVAIPEGAPNVSFTHIEEAIAVPMPSMPVFDRYVIYVGFDVIGAQERKPAAKKRPPKQS
jgi:hypothetical protein